MIIEDVDVEVFRYRSKVIQDSEGHTHPGEEHDAIQMLLRIVTDEGIEGFCFGADRRAVERFIKPVLVGEAPFYRERIWQTLKNMQRIYRDVLSDRVLTTVDMALWDLVGRALERARLRKQNVWGRSGRRFGHPRSLCKVRSFVQGPGVQGLQTPYLAASSPRGT